MEIDQNRVTLRPGSVVRAERMQAQCFCAYHTVYQMISEIS